MMRLARQSRSRRFSGCNANPAHARRPATKVILVVVTMLHPMQFRPFVGRDHVELAVSAPPIARQHAQPKRRQMVNGQLLTECADLGTGQRCHAATIRAGTDSRLGSPVAIPNHEFIHNPLDRSFADVKMRVHGAMVDKPLQGIADRATDIDAFEYAARAGFAVSGLLHLLIAYIILQIAFGSGGNADQSGALATLAAQTGGTVILWVAAVGLVALGLWRIAEAIVGSKPGEGSGHRHDDTPVWKRAKSIGLAIVNFAIALSAARFAMGSGQQSTQQNAGLSAQMMQSGWGKALLIVVALGLVAVGGYHVYKGAAKKFLKDLRVSGGTGVTAVGITGYVAKGVVLAGAGVLVIVATLQADPTKATGFDAAVKTLGHAPFGKVLLVVAALGIAAFGAYSFVRSRHGRM